MARNKNHLCVRKYLTGCLFGVVLWLWGVLPSAQAAAPPFLRIIPAGSSQIVVHNPNAAVVLVGVRSGVFGRNYVIVPGGTYVMNVPSGFYRCYYSFPGAGGTVSIGLPFASRAIVTIRPGNRGWLAIIR